MEKLARREIAAAFAMLAGTVIGLGTPRDGFAADTGSTLRTITVRGEGEVFGKPDSAQLSAGVVTQAPNAAAALAANSKAMGRVLAALKTLGIADRKIQTANFSVQPQYRQGDVPEPRAIIGYEVSNEVTATLDDVSKLGAALDQLVRSGANRLNGVAFSIADPKPLAERARIAAVADAMAKARTLAAAAGIALGPVLSIEEATGSRPAPVFARAMAMAPAPTAIGEESVTVTVTMSFGIR